MTLNWAVSPDDQAVITTIAHRIYELSKRLGREHTYLIGDAMMDVTAAHANGNPLALRQLLAAQDGDFAHDLFGIRRFLDRDTGSLGFCFRPRFSA